jgi:hypothetical protein
VSPSGLTATLYAPTTGSCFQRTHDLEQAIRDATASAAQATVWQ